MNTFYVEKASTQLTLKNEKGVCLFFNLRSKSHTHHLGAALMQPFTIISVLLHLLGLCYFFSVATASD